MQSNITFLWFLQFLIRHEEYLVVSISVENLVAIDPVISVIWKFQYQNWEVLEDIHPKWGAV